MLYIGRYDQNKYRDNMMIISSTHETESDEPINSDWILTPPQEMLWELSNGGCEVTFENKYMMFLENNYAPNGVAKYCSGKILCTNVDVIWQTVLKWLRRHGLSVVVLDKYQTDLVNF